MFLYIYKILFVISIITMLYLAVYSFSNIKIYFWTLSLLIPIIILGYIFRMMASDVSAAKTADYFVLLDGTFMPAVVILCIIQELKIKLPKFGKILMYICSLAMYIFVCVGSKLGFYYASVSLENTAYGKAFVATYGPGIYVHIVYLVFLTVILIALTIYAVINRKKLSFVTFIHYFLVLWLGVLIFSIQMARNAKFEHLPFLYVLGMIIATFTYSRSYCHDIEAITSRIQGETVNHGYVAFDMKRRLLCANEVALKMIPALNKVAIDRQINENEEALKLFFVKGLDDFINGDKEGKIHEYNGVSLLIQPSYFYVQKRGVTSGVIFEITDFTKRQKELDYINEYNDTLHDEIDKRNKQVVNIQNKVVLGLANMIENRDNNTGGHVKRTSDIIQILVKNMMKLRSGNLDLLMADDIVRAAPMHDLGKIAIDNSILCKPGKLKPDEYEIMKTHSSKSGDIVNTILGGVEEPHFVNVAFNVARYHHERYDGGGYPEGLRGTAIPLEARIMAIADVYDALVSERCYKKSMSFEEARQVMLEGMGTQFDPELKNAFELSRPEFENYYKTI